MDKNGRETEKPSIPDSHRIYGSVVHWLTILSSVMALFTPILILLKGNDNLINPYSLFSNIFQGAGIADIWSKAQGGAFPGAHYYLTHWNWGDSWGMLAVVLGCSVGLWAMIPAVILQFFKEKDRMYGILGLVFILLVFFSMVGILSLQTG